MDYQIYQQMSLVSESRMTLETNDWQTVAIIAALHDEGEHNGTTHKATQFRTYFSFRTSK
jgi:hypothetical protein